MNILRLIKKDAAPKETERKVFINEHDKNTEFGYANNHIKTSKYNIFTFLPRNLFEQFQRLANFYFLVLLILQLIPQISSLTPITTFVPLIIVLGLTALKDAMDDIQRHRSDNVVNGRISFVLRGGYVRNERWDRVEVGDIIRMENDHFIAADMLVLSSSEPNGLCYIETAELDGETNLKARQAIPETSQLKNDLDALNKFRGEIACEPPNTNLSRFTGKLTINDVSYPLTNNQILLRGCILRNTKWCFGVVLFAGQDTKLMQNSGKAQFKRTHIDRLLNYIIIGIVVFLLAMCTFCSIASSVWERRIGNKFQSIQPWESFHRSESTIAVLVFFSYIILLNTVVPISLYVSVEIIRFAHSCWINWDCKMMYNALGAKARTTSLNEELGQIKYIFSDKTGTLTQNIMTFNKCSINGRSYGDCTDENGQSNQYCDFSSNPYSDGRFQFPDSRLVKAIERGDEDCDLFFSILATCHTVMPDERNDRLIYQAQSPDEGALVDAARNFGYVFLHRTPSSIRVKIKDKLVDYELLHILDFSNVRKRMSVLLRRDEKIFLYCKGADSIILGLLVKTPANMRLMSAVNEHLHSFASDGLRTLCLAWKEIDPSVYIDWSERYTTASVTLERREEQMDALAAEIEKQLLLVGATAIEDKLQDGVPDAIASLALADIKIWVLTGDKLETAINIGYSCKLLTDDMDEVFVIDAEDAHLVQDQLSNAFERLQNLNTTDIPDHVLSVGNDHVTEVRILTGKQAESDGMNCALVIQGSSLVYALDTSLEKLFLDVACASKAVICCRVTPLQKAQVVELVKKYKNAITLAIGDGANDVSMIKVAHIGVGISGQEGMQAVLASDFAIGQFRFLKRLLLVHGRWSYYRMSKFLAYFFYKNFAFTLCQMWYAFYCGFTAQTVYDPLFLTFYNLFYTALPILALGVFDQDVNDKNSEDFPKLYAPGQRNLFFNKRTFFATMCYGVVTALVAYFFVYGACVSVDSLHGMQAFGTVVSTILIIAVTIQVALDTAYWTFFNFLTITGSVLFYVALTHFAHSALLSQPYVGVDAVVYNDPVFWLTIPLIMAVLFVPAVAFRFFWTDTRPTLSDRVRMRQKQNKMVTFLPAVAEIPSVVIPKKKSLRRSSYAFSHAQGFGDLIVTGTIMEDRDEDNAVQNTTSLSSIQNGHGILRIADSADAGLTDNPSDPRNETSVSV